MFQNSSLFGTNLFFVKNVKKIRGFELNVSHYCPPNAYVIIVSFIREAITFNYIKSKVNINRFSLVINPGER